jgi:hypothetical protein
MLSRKKTEADLAVEILLEHQEPMYYETLLKEIAQRMGRDQQISTLVPIYSRLNLTPFPQLQEMSPGMMDNKSIISILFFFIYNPGSKHFFAPLSILS